MRRTMRAAVAHSDGTGGSEFEFQFGFVMGTAAITG